MQLEYEKYHLLTNQQMLLKKHITLLAEIAQKNTTSSATSTMKGHHLMSPTIDDIDIRSPLSALSVLGSPSESTATIPLSSPSSLSTLTSPSSVLPMSSPISTTTPNSHNNPNNVTPPSSLSPSSYILSSALTHATSAASLCDSTLNYHELPLCIMGFDGNFIDANQMFYTSFCYSTNKNLIEESIFHIVKPDQLSQVLQLLQYMITEKSHAELTLPMINKLGAVSNMVMKLLVIQDKNAHLLLFVVFIPAEMDKQKIHPLSMAAHITNVSHTWLHNMAANFQNASSSPSTAPSSLACSPVIATQSISSRSSTVQPTRSPPFSTTRLQQALPTIAMNEKGVRAATYQNSLLSSNNGFLNYPPTTLHTVPAINTNTPQHTSTPGNYIRPVAVPATSFVSSSAPLAYRSITGAGPIAAPTSFAPVNSSFPTTFGLAACNSSPEYSPGPSVLSRSVPPVTHTLAHRLNTTVNSMNSQSCDNSPMSFTRTLAHQIDHEVPPNLLPAKRQRIEDINNTLIHMSTQHTNKNNNQQEQITNTQNLNNTSNNPNSSNASNLTNNSNPNNNLPRL